MIGPRRNVMVWLITPISVLMTLSGIVAVVVMLTVQRSFWSVIFSCGFLAMTLGFTSLSVLNFIWTTFAHEEIEIADGELTIRHHVLWIHRVRTFHVEKIQQLRVHERRYRGKGGERVVRQIAFDYDGAVMNVESLLSQEEADQLMKGPLAMLRRR